MVSSRNSSFTIAVLGAVLSLSAVSQDLSGKIEDVNAAVVAARTATQEKRYSDAEALMLKVTSEKPKLVIPWMELGLAQMGLKKYTEAEMSFRSALGTDDLSAARADADKFYRSPSDPTVIAPTATRQSRNALTHEANNGQARPPEVLGTAYASLGEIYIHQGKLLEAQSAFDKASQVNPPQAGTYFENEAIFFFQAGNPDAQFAAATKAIAADPKRAGPYYFKAQALTSKATIDPKTQKLLLPPGCAEAYRIYLQLAPNGQFSSDAKGVLANAPAL